MVSDRRFRKLINIESEEIILDRNQNILTVVMVYR